MKKSYVPAILMMLAAASLGLGLPACSHKGHDHQHEHEHAGEDDYEDHEHEGHEGHTHDEVLTITDYGEVFEIFAEATPLSVGHDCDILAHFTFLESFKPLGAGKVTVTLTVGSKRVSDVCDGPKAPGTYSFELTPPAVGKATLTFRIETDGRTIVQNIGGLEVYSDVHEAHEAAKESEKHVSNTVAFTKEMSWKTDFRTSEAQIKPFGEAIHASGRIQPSAGDVRQIVARAAGTVTYAVKGLADGMAVSAGQTLFHINTDATADQSMKVRLREAESNYQTAKKTYERGKTLVEEGLMSHTELLKLQNTYENAEAAWHHLDSGVGKNGGCASPLTGLVTSLDVANGQYVEAGQALATVASNRDLTVRVDLPASKAKRIAGIESVSVRPLNGDGDYQASGRLVSIVSLGKGVSGGSNRVPLVLRMPNCAGFIPGEFVNVDLRTSGGLPALTVPAGSLIEQQGVWFVFVQVTPEKFEKRSVKPGRTDGVDTEIIYGLNEGERVVSRGAVMVKLAQGSGALDPHAGHMH